MQSRPHYLAVNGLKLRNECFTRPTPAQFRSLKIYQSTHFIYCENVDCRISGMPVGQSQLWNRISIPASRHCQGNSCRAPNKPIQSDNHAFNEWMNVFLRVIYIARPFLRGCLPQNFELEGGGLNGTSNWAGRCNGYFEKYVCCQFHDNFGQFVVCTFGSLRKTCINVRFCRRILNLKGAVKWSWTNITELVGAMDIFQSLYVFVPCQL